MRARGTQVRANGIRLHCLEYGAHDPPVLLLPGITAPAATWGFVAERLAETNRVIVLDNRGRGLSESRPAMGHALDDYAKDAKGVITALGLARTVVLGHSMGGRIAARLAATAPASVARLVLADPPISGPGRKPYVTPIEPYLWAIAAASRGASVAEFRHLHPTWSDDQIRERIEWLPTCSVEAVTETHKRFQTEDIVPDFPRIRCPTLLVYAGDAAVITDAEAREIAALIPDCRAIRVAGGHMIPWDNLDGFLAAVVPFITRFANAAPAAPPA